MLKLIYTAHTKREKNPEEAKEIAGEKTKRSDLRYILLNRGPNKKNYTSRAEEKRKGTEAEVQ